MIMYLRLFYINWPCSAFHKGERMDNLVWRELLFGTFVGISEGMVVYLIMRAFGMYHSIAIYG